MSRGGGSRDQSGAKFSAVPAGADIVSEHDPSTLPACLQIPPYRRVGINRGEKNEKKVYIYIYIYISRPISTSNIVKVEYTNHISNLSLQGFV